MSSRLVTRAKIQKPGEVVVSVTMAMSLDDWKSLRGQLAQAHRTVFPAWRVIDDIDKAVHQMEGVIEVLPPQPEVEE